MDTPTPQGPAAPSFDVLAAAEAARREAFQRLAELVSRVLALGVGPGTLAFYVVHVRLVPSWQFGALLALSAAMWAGLAGTHLLVRRGRIEAGYLVAFVSMWAFSGAAFALRADGFGISLLALAANVVMIWLFAPRWTAVATSLTVAAIAGLRAAQWAGLLPQVPVPPALSLAFDLVYALAIVPILAVGLTHGHRLQGIPFRHLDAATAAQRRLIGAVVRAVPEIGAVAGGASRGAAQLAASASQQALTVERVAAAALELEGLSRKAAAAAEEARGVAEAARASSTETADALEGVERELAEFQDDLAAMRQGVEELARRSAGTEQVIESVETVHLAVNVLSINARLEATRAGEAGKGFEVVAAEMGTLIGGTEAGVREGRRLLSAVRADASAVRQRGDAAASRLAAHVAALRGARDRVRSVLDGYGLAARHLDAIASGTAEQRRQIEVVAQAMRELAATAADLERVAADLAGSVGQVARGQAELEGLLGAGDGGTPGDPAPGLTRAARGRPP